ncbi:MHYT domain-containing protein [Thermopolyspora flexuosa]|nr:MHYT domain-containing protein [Thermopolyspora flexuosa]
MSVVGSLLGLLFAARARSTEGAARVRRLAGSALALGGTGIWVMHFIAMMGFSVSGATIRYDVMLTAASAVVAVVVVGAGLLLVSYGGTRPAPLLGGGLLTGCGVASMHYLGMAAMNTTVRLSYDPVTVVLSVVIAVAAATVALWFSLRVRGRLLTLGAALLMGVAVTGMHYTGMFAMSVTGTGSSEPPPGAAPIDFLVPLLVGISLLTIGLLMAVMLSPSEKELRSEAELLARIERRREQEDPPPATGGRHRGPAVRHGGPQPQRRAGRTPASGPGWPGNGGPGAAGPDDRPSLFDPRSRP